MLTNKSTVYRLQSAAESNSRKTEDGKPLTMEELLASQTKKLITLSRNLQVEGSIVLKTDKELILDIGAKSEGVLQRKDFSDSDFENLKVGDKIKAYVAQTENDNGQTVLSMHPIVSKPSSFSPKGRGGVDWTRFIQAQRQNLKLHGKVIEVNKGGLMIEVDFVRGFLPNSQVGFELLSKAKNGLSDLVGEELNITVSEVNQEQNRLIFSQRGYVSEDVLEDLKKYKEGQKVTGKIVAVLPFGLVVDVNGMEGLVFISDVSWEKVEDLNTLFKVEQEIEVLVSGTDTELGRLNLSIKQLTEDPIDKLKEKFQPDDVVKGEVTGVSSEGVKIKLDSEIEGLIPSSKIGTNVYEVGKNVTVLVDGVDLRKRIITLAPMVTSTADLIYK